MTDDRILAFRDRLRDGDTAGAIEGFDGFDAAVDEQAARESALRDLARGVITRVEPGEPAHEAAQEFLRDVSTAQDARVKAKYDFALHLENGPSAESVADRVETVVETTAAVDEQADELRDRSGDVDLPPSLTVTGPGGVRVPKGEPVEAEFVAANLGVTAASDLSVRLDGYDLDVSPGAIDSLAAGEERALAVTGAADEAVETAVTVGVGSASASAELRVLDKAGFLEVALVVLGDVEERLARIRETADDDGGPGAGNGNGRGDDGAEPGLTGLENKLDTATQRVERLAERADGGGPGAGNGNGNGNGDSLDQRIRAVMNLLGAFINQVEGLEGGQLTGQDASVLANDATQVIDELALATRAER